MARGLAVGLLLLTGASACAPGARREAAPPGGVGAAAAALPGPAGGPPSPQFCGAVQTIIGAEPEGFARLRLEPIGAGAWRGAVVPPGFAGCGVARVGGTASPRYVCWGEGVPSRDQLPRLEPAFQRTVAHLDSCLGATPVAGGGIAGRGVARGPVMTFAGGERLALWRDPAASPGPAVALRVEEDVATGAYTLSLSAQRVR